MMSWQKRLPDLLQMASIIGSVVQPPWVEILQGRIAYSFGLAHPRVPLCQTPTIVRVGAQET